MNLRMVALFAGGGGLHLGFRKAEYETVFATDFDSAAAETFQLNLPDISFHLGDVRRLTPTAVREWIGEEQVHAVVGGPPCQGFSTLGDQIQGDPRNSLFEAFARVVKWINPLCVLMENTSYLRSQYSGQYEEEIRRLLQDVGYAVDARILNAADFGTPQMRKRLFIVGTRLGVPFVWPAPTHGDTSGLQPYATVGDTIMDIADVDKRTDLPNHTALRHKEKVLARYRLIPEGGRMPPPQSLPPDIRRRNFGNTYKRLLRSKPSLTLVPGNNAFPIHPIEDRSLTPREAARLQGFDDDYIFAGSRAEQCRLVGNAVPVQLAKALASAIRAHVENSHDATGTASQIQPETLQLPLALTGQGSRSVNGRNGRPLTAVSFFTGAGGLMLGFMRAGFDILASYDLKNHVEQNLRINFPKVRHYKADVAEQSDVEVRLAIGASGPDVVFGGPPCQGFSIFGKRRFVNTRSLKADEDPRNELALKYVDTAIGLEPKVIFLENVKGFLSTPREDSSYIDELSARLKAHGYQPTFRVVNCAHHGVPQLRERLIVIAVREDIEYDWPQQKYFEEPKSWQRGYVTVGDVIADLADESTYDDGFSHVPMAHKPLVAERYRLIPEGGRLPEDALPRRLRRGYRTEVVKNFSHVYRRLAFDRPATTLVPGHNAFPIHPFLARALTVREAARIQTFPDRIRFIGTRQQQCVLVGNAVPPLLAETFAQTIAKAIRGNARELGYKADHYELAALR